MFNDLNEKLNTLLDYMVETHGLYLESDYGIGETETTKEIYMVVLKKKDELENENGDCMEFSETCLNCADRKNCINSIDNLIFTERIDITPAQITLCPFGKKREHVYSDRYTKVGVGSYACHACEHNRNNGLISDHVKCSCSKNY